MELLLALKAEHFVAELCRQGDQHSQRPYYGNGEKQISFWWRGISECGKSLGSLLRVVWRTGLKTVWNQVTEEPWHSIFNCTQRYLWMCVQQHLLAELRSRESNEQTDLWTILSLSTHIHHQVFSLLAPKCISNTSAFPTSLRSPWSKPLSPLIKPIMTTSWVMASSPPCPPP